MPTSRQPLPAARYGCHEARQDAELVLGRRATATVASLFDEHLRGCTRCHQMSRTLEAIYKGPASLGPLPEAAQTREFQGVLQRMGAEPSEPWYQRWTVGAGVVGLAVAAAVLTLTLFDIAPQTLSLPLRDDLPPPSRLAGEGARGFLPANTADTGGLGHPGQTYGRVLGGVAKVIPPGGQAPTTDTFGVGTRFEVTSTDSLQLGLVGKIVANFTPGSRVTWAAASPSLLELQIDRGMMAVRYDRRASDPVLQVRTPSAVVRVVGTVFTVQVDAKDQTVVSVLRGQVEVLHPRTNRLLAEVESGFRFDAKRSTFGDVGRVDLAAALPLSNDMGEPDSRTGESADLADGRIPLTWNVPGLPQDPQYRTLDYAPAGAPTPTETVVLSSERDGRARERGRVRAVEPRWVEDEGEALIDRLVREVEATRRRELRGGLEACRKLYDAYETRYLAAKCLSTFLSKHGDDPLAVEAYLLVGMLRMDYALDYQAAEVAFQTFLRRAPDHPSAEFALYRMWLASTENGRISEALDRGRKYLGRYPNGRYVGKILQRFPELKSAL